MSEENEFLFFKNETQYVHVLRNINLNTNIYERKMLLIHDIRTSVLIIRNN